MRDLELGVRRVCLYGALLAAFGFGCSASGDKVPGFSETGGAPVVVQPGSGGTPTTLGSGGTTALSAAGGATATGSGGAFVRDPTLKFDWPEDTGSSGPPCKAGKYVGSFKGVYQSPLVVGIPLNIQGRIQFELNQSASGEFFEISNGHVEGAADPTGGLAGDGGGVPFSADIVGTLNCDSGQLEGGKLENGVYTAFDVITGNFDGPITGTYDRNTSTFTNGTWKVTEPANTAFGGSGTWAATWSQ